MEIWSRRLDGNLAPEKVTIIGNQIVNLPTGGFGVVISPTVRNVLVTGNRIASAHTGVIVETLGQNIGSGNGGSWNGESTWQFEGNQFVDNDAADMNILGLTASRVAVRNNTCSLQAVSTNLQCLSIDSASTIGELTIAGNESDKTIVSAAASTTVNVVGNTVTAQSGTQPLSIYAPSIGSGAKLKCRTTPSRAGRILTSLILRMRMWGAEIPGIRRLMRVGRCGLIISASSISTSLTL